MRVYERMVRPALFRLDPETAHDLASASLRAARAARPLLNALFGCRHPSLETTVAGLRFPNPVGLAAGFDKDCRMADVLPSLGFGFLELGTVTPRPQPGNPKPRVFRIEEEQALVNRLGFPGEGADAAAARLSRLGPRTVPIGINLGVNADTPPERAHKDYAAAFARLKPFGDYFVVNVSSPNTPGLRELQDRLRLERILTEISGLNQEGKPVFVKISPDIGPEALAGLLGLCLEEADGLVVANTTTDRAGLPDHAIELRGGLSGAPLRHRSTDLIAEVRRLTDGKLPIIGVGGVFSAEDAYQKFRAGASLIQVYTGLIYRGPGLVREINRGLVEMLKGHGLKNISEAVGKSESIPPTRSTPLGGLAA